MSDTYTMQAHGVRTNRDVTDFFSIIFILIRAQGSLLEHSIPRTVLTFWDPRRKARRTRHMGSKTRQQLRLRTDAEALLIHNPS